MVEGKTIYYPYLRGRQFELLALRELVERKKIADHVVPVLEPLKLTTTLVKTLQAMVRADKAFAFVVNPEYGEFWRQVSARNAGDVQVAAVHDVLESPRCILSYRMGAAETVGTPPWSLSFRQRMAIATQRDDMTRFCTMFGDTELPDYTLIPDDRVFRRRVSRGKILFQDHFVAAKRNSDYQDRPDEFFTDDHLYAAEEGYAGVADYSVIGAAYNTTGFAPVAVAIHIVYPTETGALRIHHFVSDSNEGIEDPGGKFGEAVGHLAEWQAPRAAAFYDTVGLCELLACHREGRFPGLGTVKKYSIMHHLELMEHILGA